MSLQALKWTWVIGAGTPCYTMAMDLAYISYSGQIKLNNNIFFQPIWRVSSRTPGWSFKASWITAPWAVPPTVGFFYSFVSWICWMVSLLNYQHWIYYQTNPESNTYMDKLPSNLSIYESTVFINTNLVCVYMHTPCCAYNTKQTAIQVKKNMCVCTHVH